MAEQYLLEKLKSVEQTFHDLTRRLADPDTAKNQEEYQTIAKARSGLEDVVNSYENWKTTQDDLIGARQIYKESASDPEMQEMAGLEVRELEEKIEFLENRLKVLLLPRDPNDDKNIMLEIRADVYPLCPNPGMEGTFGK
jgi:peptide chain release factor 1